jgi:mannose/cellobiose epimerase-like protein (N-acyl-D-glucosamine 2-epimerase family)
MNNDNQLRLKIATRIAAALHSNPSCDCATFDSISKDAFDQADSLLKYAAQSEPPSEASKAHQDAMDIFDIRAWAQKHDIRGDYADISAAFFDARNR